MTLSIAVNTTSPSFSTQTTALPKNAGTNQTHDNKNAAEQHEIQALKKQDQTVRNHEQAHINAAAGVAVSPPQFTYTIGPDGKSYKVSGEVSIDVSPVPNDPQATLRKAETIRRAALAPATPSSQDYQVAAKANQMASKAMLELQQQNNPGSGATLNVQA